MAAAQQFPTPDDRWLVMKAFFDEYGLVRHHINSFNRFLDNELSKIVKEFGTISTLRGEYEVRLEDVKLGEPVILEASMATHAAVTPMECRIRDLTYAAPIKVRVTIVENGVEREPEEATIGYLPIMLRSKADPLAACFYEGRPEEECIERLVEAGEDPKDPGGYFIINGSERVVVMQEDQALNRILVDKARAGTSALYTAKVISAHAGVRYQLILDMHKDGTLQVSMTRALGKIPFVVLMRALGLEKDLDITLAVSPDPEIRNLLIPSLEQVRAISTVEDALDFIGSRFREGIGKPREQRIRIAERVLDTLLLPHLGTRKEDRIKKAIFLGQMANKLLEFVLGRRGPDDKDHYANKRILLAGDLVAIVFRVAMRVLANDIRQQLERARSRGRKVAPRLLIRQDIITNRVREALATGNWPGQRTGVSQILDRTNWLSMLSHLRRVISPLSRSQPHFEARDVHGTQWGRICPFETPEGPNCGLVKNLAVSAYISAGVDEEVVEKILKEELGVQDAVEVFKKVLELGDYPPEIAASAKVFLNGRLVGYHPDGEWLVNTLRRLRRNGKIPPEVSVSLYRTDKIYEVYINTDPGRVLRPVFVVENGELKYKPEHAEKLRKGEWKFSDLLKHGIVELLDPEEEENAYIAINPEDLTKEHTHMEIWPAGIFSVTASTIPYAEHNQAPRNTYQAAMAKQALGIYAINYQVRVDTRGHLLHYPEKPLVQTRMLDVMGFNERPAGHNAIVAVMSFTGYNIEDAIIMNKSSVERGFARSTFFRLYQAEERRYMGGLTDRIEIPETGVEGAKPPELYSKLDADGIVSPEVHVRGGEILIGKTSPPRFMEEYREFGTVAARRRDTSIPMRYGEKGVVDTVLITENIEGFKLVKVKVRDLRIPELGDKFASRHGQKGVIGMLIPEYDMPFTEDGITPDIIINPHAFPSRMTLGQMLETIAGKYAALAARFVDGTPFAKEPLENIRIGLLRLGYAPNGAELVYDGRTGELIRTPILIGVVYYQKLHHMVADKIHARARGPVQILTRQPTEGRAREGGLRFGEMERDCLVGHGAAMLLRERMLESSDRYVMYVCELCGHIAWFNRYRRTYVCPIHGDKGKISAVTVPYAFKLLLQELMSMCIMPRLRLGYKYEWRPLKELEKLEEKIISKTGGEGGEKA